MGDGGGEWVRVVVQIVVQGNSGGTATMKAIIDPPLPLSITSPLPSFVYCKWQHELRLMPTLVFVDLFFSFLWASI